MGGFAAEELILFSAGQGQGKSYFMLWFAERMVEAGHNTLYVTIEMSYEATMARYNSIQTGVNSLDIADKRILPAKRAEYFERLIAANKEKNAREAFLRECATIKNRHDPRGALALAKKYKNRPAKMFMMDLPSGVTPARIEQEIQRISMDNMLDCMFVEFINVMDPTFHNKDRARELANIARELKVCARKCKVRMFTAAQLDTTSLEKTQDEVITTDHIKYSKAIGENSDWVMGFFRTEEDNLKKQLRIQMVKTRGSAPVTALLEFDFATSQAIDLGFADGSPIPYGYLKNGMKTEAFILAQEARQETIQEDLGALATEAMEPVSVPTPTSGPSDVQSQRDLDVLKSTFKGLKVTEVPMPEEIEDLPPF
jgi:replicative DNA helicase